MRNDKQVICFDLEATGTDIARDRIVQFAGINLVTMYEVNWLVNPTIPIPPGATEIHNICDADVARMPPFEQRAQSIYEWIKDCDLLGFNLTNFDVPMLWEEFYRCGIVWDLSNTRIFDAGTLFKKREERTLAAALKFYCNRDLTNAHNALADVKATREVWLAQMDRYQLWGKSRLELEQESNYEEKRVDLAGKILLNKDGVPVYNIGKSKGVPVVDDPGFGYWMLDRDFSENTKIALRRILGLARVFGRYTIRHLL